MDGILKHRRRSLALPGVIATPSQNNSTDNMPPPRRHATRGFLSLRHDSLASTPPCLQQRFTRCANRSIQPALPPTAGDPGSRMTHHQYASSPRLTSNEGVDVIVDHEHDEDDRESVDSLYQKWEIMHSRLRRTGDEVRALHTRTTFWHGSEPRYAADWAWIMQAFAREVTTAKRSDFQDLILQTTELHHRGTGVLSEDHGPEPIPSPFVRRLPPNQNEIEAKRRQRQVRHVLAYQEHIRHCLKHFVTAWTALIDGCLICDWEMIDDEFPKLAQLLEEAQRAFDIWVSLDQ